MTTEEKAKAYDKALERAKNFIENGDEGEKTIAESIFHGLIENEDEKIRKSLIGHLRECRNQCCSEVMIDEYAKWIGCLEKTGEQKPIDSLKLNELTWKDIDILEGIINNVHYEFRNGIGKESFGKEVLERFRENKGEEYVDSCEQKPVWSEEDERLQQCLIGDQEKCLEEVKNDKVGHSEIISDLKEMYRERIDWLKSIKERLKGGNK